jgi:hypothetical protein
MLLHLPAPQQPAARSTAVSKRMLIRPASN